MYMGGNAHNFSPPPMIFFSCKAPFTLWRLSAVFGVSRRLTESPWNAEKRWSTSKKLFLGDVHAVMVDANTTIGVFCALCGDAWRSLPANRTESANDVCVRRRSMAEGRMSTAIVSGSDTAARRFIATMRRKQYAQWRLTATTCLLLGAVEFPKMWLE